LTGMAIVFWTALSLIIAGIYEVYLGMKLKHLNKLSQSN